MRKWHELVISVLCLCLYSFLPSQSFCFSRQSSSFDGNQLALVLAVWKMLISFCSFLNTPKSSTVYSSQMVNFANLYERSFFATQNQLCTASKLKIYRTLNVLDCGINFRGPRVLLEETNPGNKSHLVIFRKSTN